MRKTMLLVCIGVAVASMFVPRRSCAEEALVNPGFEKVLAPWASADYGEWHQVAVLDTAQKHDGKNSAKFLLDGTMNRGMLRQDIVLPPNAGQIELSGWVKTQDLAPGWYASLWVEFVKADGTWNGIKGGTPVTKSADWTNVKLKLESDKIPAGSARMTVECIVARPKEATDSGKGSVWFSDLTLTVTQPK